MKPRISIFSTQLPELTMAGGIGSLNKRFAVFLTDLGYEVEILVSETELPLSNNVIGKYKQMGIAVRELPRQNLPVNPKWLSLAYRVQQYYEENSPDLIISQEWQAPLVIVAALGRIPVITWLHGGTIYDKIGANLQFDSKDDFIRAALEGIQVDKSKLCISPTKFLIDFYKNYNWNLSNSRILSYPFPEFEFLRNPPNHQEEVVLAFVGSLSTRKGIDLAVTYAKKLKNKRVEFTFYLAGKDAEYSGSDIKRQLNEAGIEVVLKQHLDSKSIWQELSLLNSTVLIPSRLDNVPGVAYEALSSGCKILVTEHQGTIELKEIFPEQVSKFDFEIDSNLDFLFKISNRNEAKEKSHDVNKQLKTEWISIIKESIEKKREVEGNAVHKGSVTAVSVVIITKNRPTYFEEALKSVLNQTLPPREIVVIEELSETHTTVEVLCQLANLQIPVIYLQVDNKDEKNFQQSHQVAIGQARAAFNRNLGVEHSNCELVTFLDDDNLFKPNHIETMVNALNINKADAVTSFLEQVYSDNPIHLNSKPNQIGIMLGGSLGDLNLLANVATDSSLLIKREIFQSVGGFSVKNYPEDWALGIALTRKEIKFISTGLNTVVHRLNTDGIQYKISTSLQIPFFLEGIERSSSSLSWYMSSLARLQFSNSLSSSSYTGNSKKTYYFSHAIELIKARNFKAFLFGIRKYLRRKLYLKVISPKRVEM